MNPKAAPNMSMDNITPTGFILALPFIIFRKNTKAAPCNIDITISNISIFTSPLEIPTIINGMNSKTTPTIGMKLVIPAQKLSKSEYLMSRKFNAIKAQYQRITTQKL